MQLVELCEPAFQYVCKLNRIGERGNLDFQLVRREVKDLLTAIEQRAGMDRLDADKFAKIKLPLIFFIDSMIVESGIRCASEWDSNRMAYDHNELSGDESFYDDLDRTLSDLIRIRRNCSPFSTSVSDWALRASIFRSRP
jgi:type VI protein secretion system component VasF